MSFELLGLSPSILRAVTAEGYTTPTPIQSQSIPHVMAGKDLLGCAQTGTGKTAAFALPILHRLSQTPPPGSVPATGANPQQHAQGTKQRPTRRTRVLVLSPTRELASQIGESFKAYGKNTNVRQVVIYGGVGQSPQVRSLQQGVDVVVATPGRLLDLMNQGHAHLNNVEIFVLDEADRMMDMGFLPDLKRIIAKLPTQRQTLFFSATMPEPIEKLANSILRSPVRLKIEPVKATAELIDHSLYFVSKGQKTRLLASLIDSKNSTRAIVFTRTKHGADRVTVQLNRAGIKAQAIHGNKSQSARQKALEAFKASKLEVLVATDLAARGIDVDGVSHVFNYDLPEEPETYVHRIGRTGRAGATGVAIAFCDAEEKKYLRGIERLLNRPLTVEKLPEGMAQLAEADNAAARAETRPPRPQQGKGGRGKAPTAAAKSGKSGGGSGGGSGSHAGGSGGGRPTTGARSPGHGYKGKKKRRFASRP